MSLAASAKTCCDTMLITVDTQLSAHWAYAFSIHAVCRLCCMPADRLHQCIACTRKRSYISHCRSTACARCKHEQPCRPEAPDCTACECYLHIKAHASAFGMVLAMAAQLTSRTVSLQEPT